MYRFFCLQSHYRKGLVFSWEHLVEAVQNGQPGGAVGLGLEGVVEGGDPQGGVQVSRPRASWSPTCPAGPAGNGDKALYFSSATVTPSRIIARAEHTLRTAAVPSQVDLRGMMTDEAIANLDLPVPSGQGRPGPGGAEEAADLLPGGVRPRPGLVHGAVGGVQGGDFGDELLEGGRGVVQVLPGEDQPLAVVALEAEIRRSISAPPR